MRATVGDGEELAVVTQRAAPPGLEGDGTASTVGTPGLIPPGVAPGTSRPAPQPAVPPRDERPARRVSRPVTCLVEHGKALALNVETGGFGPGRAP